MEIVKFVVGQTYSCRLASDHNCIERVTITKRTAQTVTGVLDGKTKTWRVREYNGTEIFSPLGRYSMSPTLYANDTSDKQPDAGW
jgi:hypothetical protein